VVGVASAAHFVSHFYFLVFPPLFPLFRAEFGVSNTQLGLMFSLLFLMPSVLQVPVGDLVDRLGAKRIFVVGIAVTGLGTMATALADSYLSLVGFVLLAGVGQSVFHPADFALIETVTEASNRGKSFGAHTFAGYLGFAAAPLVAGGLGVRFGWRTALASLGVIGILYAIAVALTMAPVHRGRTVSDEEADDGGFGSSWSELADPRILLTVVFFVILTIAATGIQSFTVVFLTDVFDLGVTMANTTLTANLTATALGVLAGGVLADRFSIYGVLAATLTAAALVVGVIVSGVIPGVLVAVFAGFTALGLVHGLSLPSRDSLVSEFSTADSTGKSFGLAYTGVTVGAFIAPALFGFVSDAVSNQAMFALIAVFYLGAVLTVGAIHLGYVRTTSSATGP
jgi:MFS family permease